MNRFDTYLQKMLDKRFEEGALRKLPIFEGGVDFCSNDYLGFSRSAVLKEAIINAVSRFETSIGSTGSRLITGNSTFIEEVEFFLAKYHRSESGLLFNSGYDANIGLFSSVPQRQDTILYDELIHASIRDGIRLSWADTFSFKHNDLNSLKRRLEKAKGNIYVAIESVYSMDGDLAPLNDIVELCDKYNAALIVDEAHAVGVYGTNGEGLVVQNNLEHRIYARINTFGKAMGVHGAVVLGSNVLRNFLINYARSFIYTTAMSLHSVIAIHEAHKLLAESKEIQKQLHDRIAYFRNKVLISTLLSDATPIQSYVVSGNIRVKEKAAEICSKGMNVKAIMTPTVPKGKERIRICLHAYNSYEEIDTLVDCLNSL